ncbi:MAG: hypothetical protein JJ974_10725 [Phycisphaerales bacterium]|nr:hypothetical protein [Phycisphaerales bacterium]
MSSELSSSAESVPSGPGVSAGVSAGIGLDAVVDQVDRVEMMLGELAGLESAVERGRMFAHEVNNLMMAVSGRAQRGLLSGDAEHAREALTLAADVGGRIAGLCGVFLEGESSDRPISLSSSQIYGIHEFAMNCVGVHPVLVSDGGGVEFEFVDGTGTGTGTGLGLGSGNSGGVRMDGMLLGQVLWNRYRNARTGIARGEQVDSGAGRRGVVRLSCRVLDQSGRGGMDGGVELVVEDSGVGFGECGDVDRGGSGGRGGGGGVS